MYWAGIILSFFLFGYMAFSSRKRRDPAGWFLYTPLALQIIANNGIIDLILTFLYPVALLIIILSPGNIIINILTVIALQFVIYHIIWGTITGIIEGRQKSKELQDFLTQKGINNV